MVSQPQKLYIYTFKDFLVKQGNEPLFANKKLNKRWKLLLLLLFRAGKTISAQQLIKELNLSDNFTPRQSLRALVYRLRQEIETKNSQNHFIYTEKGGYGFNSSSNYWVDCKQFKKLISRAEQADVKISEGYQKALKLYQGPFLNNQNLENSYLIKMKNYYRNLYLKTIKETAKVLLNQEKFMQAVDLYETALQMYPLQVDLYLGLITTLKKAEKPGLARIRAEEALSILRSTGMKVPAKLEKEVANFFQVSLDKTPESALNNRSQTQGEVFECGPLTFSNIYDLEKRRSKRIKKEIYLIHFQLSKGSSPKKMRQAEKVLRQTFYQHLRISDVVTRWEPGHYLQLAINLSAEEIKKILNRIEKKYQNQFPPAEVSLTYKFQKL